MSYNPQWSNGTNGRLDGEMHRPHLSDAAELAEAVNRRRRLVYATYDADYSSHIHGGAYVRSRTFSAMSPPFQAFRDAFTGTLLHPATGMLGGEPPSPSAMRWLASDGKLLTISGDPGEDETSFFAALNGGKSWTDAPLSDSHPIRAPHINELRAAAELMIRGRWEMPIHFAAGIISLLPDTPWFGELISSNGEDELRSIGHAYLRRWEDPFSGLRNVTVLSSSRVKLQSQRECSVALHHCGRSISWLENPPTWNSACPGEEDWETPGGTGCDDGSFMGTASLTGSDSCYTGSMSGASVAAGLQAIVDGGEQNFLARRLDTGDPIAAQVYGSLVIEFEVNTPPN